MEFNDFSLQKGVLTFSRLKVFIKYNVNSLKISQFFVDTSLFIQNISTITCCYKMLMVTSKSTYLLGPIHKIRPLASGRFLLEEMHNFFSIESMKNHEKSWFVCSEFFSNNELSQKLLYKSSSLLLFSLALYILLKLILTQTPASILRSPYNLHLILTHYI